MNHNLLMHLLVFLSVKVPIILASSDEIIKYQNPKSSIKPFTINQALLHFQKETDKDSKSFAEILSNQPNIVCLTTINNRDYVTNIVSAPILEKISPFNVYNLRLDIWEKYYHTIYVKPLLETIVKKTDEINEALSQLEKENKNITTLLEQKQNENETLKAQLSGQKKYSFFAGITLFFAGCGLQYLCRYLNFDLSDLFK